MAAHTRNEEPQRPHPARRPRIGLGVALVVAGLAGVLGIGLRLEGPAPGPAALLPERFQPAARALLAEADPEQRAARLRQLARDAGTQATPFVIGLLESDPSARVRERAARHLRGRHDPDALDALARAAASDPSVAVVLRAMEELDAIHSARMHELIAQRLARSPVGSDLAPDDRRALLEAEEHWLTVARGGLLPAFLRTPPPVFTVLPPQRRVRVVAFGDFGSGEADQLGTASALARFHARSPVDLGLTLGDNFYPRGIAGLDDPLWQTAWVAPYAALGIPFYATLGNHDWGLPGSPAAEILYDEPGSGWHMPAARYTFTAGPAQFFALDTTALSQAQLEWLDAELARSRATWKVVYGHHPIRSHGRSGEDAAFVETLLPLLRGRADLYLAGHEHNLQVLEPEDGVHFVVAGGGGKSIRETGEGPRTRFAASAFGFAVLDIEPERIHLRMIDRDLDELYATSIQR